MNKNRFVVLIPDRLAPPADIEQQVFGDLAEIRLLQANHVSEISDEEWAVADAILPWHDLYLDAATIAKMKNCKVIVRVGVGFDNIDLIAAAQLGIPVCNVPDYGTGDVADHAMAFILALSRGLAAGNSGVRKSNDNWTWEQMGNLRRLSGATLGIVGLGRIGTAVARRAQGFGLHILFYDPYLPDGVDKALGIERAETLDELLQRADIVTIHTPLTDETRGMVNVDFFAKMQCGSLFINTARGRIVDLDALESALRTKHLRGAGLDVLPDEPPNREHPLIKAWIEGEDWITDRLIISPHGAFWCKEAFEEMRRKAAQGALRVLTGHPPRNRVN